MKIIEILESLYKHGQFRFGWIGKFRFGEVNANRDEVVLNLESMVVYVFVHECMHILYPHIKNEAVIDAKTDIYMSRMRTKEVRQLAERILELWKR